MKTKTAVVVDFASKFGKSTRSTISKPTRGCIRHGDPAEQTGWTCMKILELIGVVLGLLGMILISAKLGHDRVAFSLLIMANLDLMIVFFVRELFFASFQQVAFFGTSLIGWWLA